MKFASAEIREKAVHAYLEGKGTARQLADIFGYTPATICNWVRAYRQTQQLSAKPNGHRKSCFTEEELAQLKEVIAETPDITLQEIKIRFNKSCCLAAICRILAKLGFSYKKTLKASEQDREDVKQKREKWRIFQKNSSLCHFVFLDETGAKTNMTRLYGRSLGGSRCRDHAPDGRWERTTILSALRENGETCSMVFEGAVDRRIFEAYIEKFLSPTLQPGDVVVMDNLNVHKSERVQSIIASQGARCMFLPEYSPDLNPIEKMWSKVKQTLRGIKARTRQELDDAIAKALDMVTAVDARGWFESCGYV